MKPEEVNVLVVDDDAIARSIIVEFLEKFGYRKVIALSDGGSAIKYIQDCHHAVDLILSDWEMPQGTGLQLLKAVRQNSVRKYVKFIMITSQRSQERFKITQAAHWRVDGYIIKPFRGEVLEAKLLELITDLVDESDKSAA